MCCRFSIGLLLRNASCANALATLWQGIGSSPMAKFVGMPQQEVLYLPPESWTLGLRDITMLFHVVHKHTFSCSRHGAVARILGILVTQQSVCGGGENYSWNLLTDIECMHATFSAVETLQGFSCWTTLCCLHLYSLCVLQLSVPHIWLRAGISRRGVFGKYVTSIHTNPRRAGQSPEEAALPARQTRG
jgi:hypothetical protein